MHGIFNGPATEPTLGSHIQDFHGTEITRRSTRNTARVNWSNMNNMFLRPAPPLTQHTGTQREYDGHMSRRTKTMTNFRKHFGNIIGIRESSESYESYYANISIGIADFPKLLIAIYKLFCKFPLNALPYVLELRSLLTQAEGLLELT